MREAWPISETPKREPPCPQAVWTEPSAEVASGEPQGYGARTRDPEWGWGGEGSRRKVAERASVPRRTWWRSGVEFILKLREALSRLPGSGGLRPRLRAAVSGDLARVH